MATYGNAKRRKLRPRDPNPSASFLRYGGGGSPSGTPSIQHQRWLENRQQSIERQWGRDGAPFASPRNGSPYKDPRNPQRRRSTDRWQRPAQGLGQRDDDPRRRRNQTYRA